MDGEGVFGTGEPVARERRGRWWLTRAALLLLAAASLVVLADELPDLGQVWATATRAEPVWLAVLVVTAALSMGAFARLQHRLLRRGGLRISLRRTFAVTYAGNALSTTLPAGPAVSVVYTFRQFRRSGATAQLATAVIVIGGVITTTAYSLVALLALLAEPHSRIPAALALAGLAVPAALAVLLWSASRRASWPARLTAPARRAVRACLERPQIAPHVRQFREVVRSLAAPNPDTARPDTGHAANTTQTADTVQTADATQTADSTQTAGAAGGWGRGPLRLSAGDWGTLAVFALLNWLFDILALVAATRSVGIEVSPYGVALAYFAAQAAGSLLPVLPGGLGAIESAMAGALVALGSGLASAGAAVGLYRLVSYWGIVTVGWLAWLALRERPRRAPGLTRRRVLTWVEALGTGFAATAGMTVCRTLPAVRSADTHRPG
ncbi:conserved hypothetical protein [Thermomonospora echinospora]|uniref:Lysylphosphatidylglycerol synthase TM region n=1 Tax=Thermomonospora echinospora TaxID=1992 RepID=A0A1H6BMJ5_9ACTN|nr:conserved hypothetical protein [Thermomonospora echinospora]